MADQSNLLHSSVDAASHSPQCVCIVTDMSTPPLPLQSVAAFHLWHEGDLYNNWSAASLAMSDDTELRAIVDSICQAYNVGLEDVHQVHVFSDSANARWGAVTWMLNGWNSLFQSKKYIRSNFLTLYQRKDNPLVLAHVKSGLWMCKVGHSHSLTACLVCCTTGHALIRAFCARFFPVESFFFFFFGSSFYNPTISTTCTAHFKK
jgi:hypothetical protein